MGWSAPLKFFAVSVMVASTRLLLSQAEDTSRNPDETCGAVLLQTALHKEPSGNLSFIKTNTKQEAHKSFSQQPHLSDITAVLLESRPLVTLPVVVKNLNYRLPGVAIQIFYAAANEAFLKEQPSLAELRKRHILTLTPLPEPVYSNGITRVPDSYSPPLWNKSFWQHIEPLRRKVLIFQVDSWVCPGAAEFIEPFMNYALVGSPFILHYEFCPGGVGNGGFSLHDRKAIVNLINLLERFPEMSLSLSPEDLAFCHYLTKYGWTMPNRTEAARFSWGPHTPVKSFKGRSKPELYASYPLIRSVGVHMPQWFNFFGHTLEEVDAICPGVAFLGSALDDGSGKDAGHVVRQWEESVGLVNGPV